MPPKPTFSADRDGDILILTPLINMSELEYSQTMSAEILALFNDTTIRHLVLDFQKTDYFGSTALGFFIRLWKMIKDRGGRMVMCNMSAHESEILEVTKLTEYWSIVPTREAALKAIQG
jgi:stage II sporulation protein AA (anti-sigma F factor antagonist)